MKIADDSKPRPLGVTWLDGRGFPATVDGDTVFASDNEAVAKVSTDADGKPQLEITGSPGQTCQITATADADLGAGTRQVIATGTVEVVAGEAVTGTLNIGDPVAAAGGSNDPGTVGGV